MLGVPAIVFKVLINKTVHIVILNWNNNEDLFQCIDSLLHVTYRDYHLIIVDNGSAHENYNHLIYYCKEHFNHVIEYTTKQAIKGGEVDYEEIVKANPGKKSVLLIRNETNFGFAGGNNIGLKYILNSGRENDPVLLLNNDTVVTENFLDPLVTLMEKDEYVACTPQIRYYKPANRIWNCGGRLNLFGTRSYYYYYSHIDRVPQNGSREITFVTGCALMFLPLKTGLLSEKFFFGEEDFEFSLRMKRKGLRMACCFESVIYHKVGGTVNNLENSSLLNRIVLFYVSRLIDLKDYYPQWMIAFYFKPLFFIHILFLVALKNERNILKGLKVINEINRFVKFHESIGPKEFNNIMAIEFN